MTLGGEGTLGLSPKNIKRCFGLNNTGEIIEFNSILEAAKFVGSESYAANISSICRGKNNFCKGWRFSCNKEDLLKPIVSMAGRAKKPNKYGVKIWGKSIITNEIKAFDNPYRAAEYINGHHTLVRKVAKGKSIHTKNWKFSYTPFT
jgi:hypothetical protein